MIDASRPDALSSHPPRAVASLEAPTLWTRLYPYLFLTAAALLISSCTA